MKKSIKRILALIFAIASISAFGVTAFAEELTVDELPPEFNVVIIDEEGNISFDYDSSIPDIGAIFEGSTTRASIVVTASDVWKVTNLSDHGYEYWAEGYVTAEQYHYARAEMWYNGSIYAEGFEHYGYGKVESTSQICYGPNAIPKIFYGA